MDTTNFLVLPLSSRTPTKREKFWVRFEILGYPTFAGAVADPVFDLEPMI